MTNNSSLNEIEFLKRNQMMNEMLHQIREQEELIKHMKKEEGIPERAHDLVMTALTNELIQKKTLFYDFLINFISFGMPWSYKIDIEVYFIATTDNLLEILEGAIVVGKKFYLIPLEIVNRFVNSILQDNNGDVLSGVLSFYQEQERHYDQISGVCLDSCYLKIMEELFPGTGRYYIHIRLPAQILIEKNITVSDYSL